MPRESQSRNNQISVNTGVNGTHSVSEYKFYNGSIHPEKRILVSNGHAITPRPRVFEVLHYLVQNRERLVHREELLKKFWKDIQVSENSLAQCIIEIRKLLGDNAREPTYIRNAPRVGYQWIAPVEEVYAGVELEVEDPPQRSVGWLRAHKWPWVLGAGAAIVLAGSSFHYVNKNPADLDPVYREVAWWRLDEQAGSTAADSSGYGEVGAVRSPAGWMEGQFHGALRFDGLNTVVSGTGNGSLPGGDKPRTISLWMKPDLPVVQYMSLFKYGSDFRGPTIERFHLGMEASGALWSGWGEASQIRTSSLWNDGAWHHVVVTYEPAPVKRLAIYVDGKLEASKDMVPPAFTNNRAAWRIGEGIPGSELFHGLIDDVRVYNLALNAGKVHALYRCTASIKDLDTHFYLPIGVGLKVEDRKPGEGSAAFHNDGMDYAGIQLARPVNDCELWSLRGAGVGQDLRISVDLLTPSGESGKLTEAGPYFRSRKAAGGDGLFGGTTAGYWVQLVSNGSIRIKRLNPMAVVAYAPPIAGFDSKVYHRLEAEARGELLEVWLDGRHMGFQQGDKSVDKVAIPEAWKGPPVIGYNHGAAGVLFGVERNRGLLGGQWAKNLRVTKLQ